MYFTTFHGVFKHIMAYDGLMAAAVLSEIRESLCGAIIEKVTQPEPDRIVMQLRTFQGRKKLLLDVSSPGARVQYTELEQETRFHRFF